ncbi:MAG: GIY-YIG nuclease family protein [Rickettsiales bacterium]|jgi:hypothetical protein|nr:GIY-YIG nuclease family protein [Rickettsiales bacterium]
MAKGVVYIFINPSMPDWVKIGFTENDDIQSRLRQVNACTEVPLRFHPYALLYSDNPYSVEQRIHRLLDVIDPSLHSIEKLDNGRERIREFFQISPEKAYMVFREVAEMLGLQGSLKLWNPTKEQETEESVVRERRTNTTFKMLDIPVGAELSFLHDPLKKCITRDDNNLVEFEGAEYALSALSNKLLGWSATQGARHFVYEDETLWDRRLRMEQA